jgi:hypothetical protein
MDDLNDLEEVGPEHAGVAFGGGVVAGLAVSAPAGLLATIGYASFDAGSLSAVLAVGCGVVGAVAFAAMFPNARRGQRLALGALSFGFVGCAHAAAVLALASPGASGDYWSRDLGPLTCVLLPPLWAVVGLVWGAATGPARAVAAPVAPAKASSPSTLGDLRAAFRAMDAVERRRAMTALASKVAAASPTEAERDAALAAVDVRPTQTVAGAIRDGVTADALAGLLETTDLDDQERAYRLLVALADRVRARGPDQG